MGFMAVMRSREYGLAKETHVLPLGRAGSFACGRFGIALFGWLTSMFCVAGSGEAMLRKVLRCNGDGAKQD